MILVVAEQRDGKLNRASWEAVAAAQKLAAIAGRRADHRGRGGRQRRRGGRGTVGRRGRPGARRRGPGTRAVHRRRLRRGAGAARGRPGAHVRAVPAHVSRARLRAEAGGDARCPAHRRRGRHRRPRRHAGVHAPDLPGQAGGRRRAGRRRAVSGDDPGRRVQRRQRRARRRRRRRCRRSRSTVDAASIRQKPDAPFREAKQAVDLSQAGAHRRRRARHQGAGQAPAGRGAGRGARRRARRVAADLRRGLAADRAPGRQLRADGRAQALPRARHLRRDPARRRHEGGEDDRRDQQGRRGADLRAGRLRHRRRSVRDRAGAR